VSNKLKASPSCSKLITAEETEMPRSRSTAIQSERTRRRSPRALTSPASWDRSAKQQQVLGQGGLAGVRVRNDRKGPPARNLVGKGGHQLGFSCWLVRGPPEASGLAAPAPTMDIMAARPFANSS
jgi:hypothetical protein